MIEFNLDLLAVGITVAGTGVLGFTILFSEKASITNRTFFAFSIITMLWSIANYLQYQPSDPEAGLWIVRIIIFLGAWHAFSFFQLCYVFPRANVAFPAWYRFAAIPAVILISAATLTPLALKEVTSVSPNGVITSISNGPIMPLFGVIVSLLIISGILLLIRKAYRATPSDRLPIVLIGTGTLITFIFILIFNLILPAAFDNPRFLPLSAVFIFPFIAFTAYAILRHKLFNIKVTAVSTLVFVLAIGVFAEIIFSTDALILLFRSSIFLLVLAAGVLLIRAVIREVEQRELIEKQERELHIINAQQESLLHFISHEVKGYLTKNQAAFASITEGDYGALPQSLKRVAALALADTRKGVETVMSILEASDMKSGSVTYAREEFDLRELAEQVVRDLSESARERNLALTFSAKKGSYVMRGDKEKLQKHVVRNLVDNAIRYTLSGSVKVALERDTGTIRLTVSDTGVGITPEDMAQLFTQGGRGKESTKVNVHSTGYGLFIAKSIVEAHKGRIWAESEGKGKGSRFIVELPA
ncbi:hypothetical protein COU20_03765 [Candidatus Kaiserbacteria bacterium CG10_big_fil_rev_8_21_14_0_10_59_10]|uniref:histidine kinase n=1 Tax=Candidatus Kaiserbacteria bacterium CG10_big_fil_rev_8_21_14_0_10_59_10 TaxID=1974612 RepID=A0A2H0U988_9BACT|nr:MAG: hypothetical protein COU20_03765 [Candidatus Kaiserbacteria bacterium CG10_big_fil_rev_8_21_14_0_10_59_10]